MKRINGFFHLLLRFKYLVTFAFFLLIVGVLDENSLMKRYEKWNVLSELRSELQMYQDKYNSDTKMLKSLSNRDTLERFARENYYMHRENEEVFVIVED